MVDFGVLGCFILFSRNITCFCGFDTLFFEVYMDFVFSRVVFVFSRVVFVLSRGDVCAY